MPVARRPVDDHAVVHQVLAGFVDVIDVIGQMPEMPAVGGQPFVAVPVIGQLELGRVRRGRAHEDKGEPPSFAVVAALFLKPHQFVKGHRGLQILHPHHRVVVFNCHFLCISLWITPYFVALCIQSTTYCSKQNQDGQGLKVNDMSKTPETQDEIAELRAQKNVTARVVSPGMEARLYTPHPVLDHGFVRVIDYMGDDAAICQAARVSYGKGTKSVSNDEGLIRYLMRHWHSTPFEMCEVKFHVKLPVFVARQWIRHRTANVNEYSARYSILDREFYIPAPEDLAAQSVVNNQGRGEALTGEEAARVLDYLRDDAARCYDHYEDMISQDGQAGLARELARMNLPANVYTQWYWKVDLHNLFHFLRLRADAHAQYEIRVYAEMMCEIVKDWVPAAYGAFEDYRLGGAQLSEKGLQCLRRMLAGEEVTQETSGMSKGEWREFMGVIGD